ncbi:MAG: sugar transferase [Coriobacteriia bacterium]
MMVGEGGIGFVERGRRQRLLVIVLLGVDIVALLSATLFGTYIRFHTLQVIAGLENISLSVGYYEVSWVLAGVWLAALIAERLYDVERLFWGTGEFTRIVRALALGLVVFIVLTFSLKMPGLSRLWILITFALANLFVLLGRLVVRLGLRTVRLKGGLQRRTLIVGANQEARQLIVHLKAYPEAGLCPVGCLASSQYEHLPLDYCAEFVPAWGTANELVETIEKHHIDTVIIAASAFEHEIIARLIADMRGLDVSVHLSSGLFEVLTSRLWVREIAGVPLITVKGVTLSRANLATKRVFDVVVASLIVALGMPVWLALALAIRLDSHGPVFYKQTRVGKGAEQFPMFKFRSMCNDAEGRLKHLQDCNEASGPLFKMRDDPRVTSVGKWMRKYSIDEFPQLLNVLRGEMSLVGPRPPLEPETAQYTDHHWRRMEVPPGMTGLWQVSGRSSLTFEEMIRLDLYYIENWSVGFDIALLFRTLPAVLFAKGAW